MPHIVLDRRLNLFDFSILFQPEFQKSPLIKISDMYVDTRGSTALFSTVVIDKSPIQFFIQLITAKNRTTIRLLPITDPPKTDSVKQSLANLYFQIKKYYPDINIQKSNLWDYLKPNLIQ